MPTERLIEAERLKAELRGLYELAGWGEREVHFSLADMDCNIDMEDSVEAIPVEWVRKYLKKRPFALAYGMMEAWTLGKEE